MLLKWWCLQNHFNLVKLTLYIGDLEESCEDGGYYLKKSSYQFGIFLLLFFFNQFPCGINRKLKVY